MKRSSRNPDPRHKSGAKPPTAQQTVRREEAGRYLVDWLRQRLALPRDTALAMVQRGLVRVGGKLCVEPQQRVQKGQRIDIRPPKKLDKGTRGQGDKATRGQGDKGTRGQGDKGKKDRPDVSVRAGGGGRRDEAAPGVILRYADEHVVVVEKPPGLTTMRHAEEADEFGPRGKRFLPPTLADILPGLLANGRTGRQPPVRAVHRIDNETSGLVVFARTVEAERRLGQQFRAHSTERVYLALVRGRAKTARIESHLVRDRGDKRRGSATKEGEGQRAVTHVRVVEELGAYTLVECRLETGRTHQVRIHLGEAGTPLCGEHIYDRPLHGKPLPDNSGAQRIMLHAASLAFEHPATGERREWRAELPDDMADLLRRLRQQSKANDRTLPENEGARPRMT